MAKLRTLKSDGTSCSSKPTWAQDTAAPAAATTYLREIALDYAFILRESGIS